MYGQGWEKFSKQKFRALTLMFWERCENFVTIHRVVREMQHFARNRKCTTVLRTYKRCIKKIDKISVNEPPKAETLKSAVRNLEAETKKNGKKAKTVSRRIKFVQKKKEDKIYRAPKWVSHSRVASDVSERKPQNEYERYSGLRNVGAWHIFGH